MMTSSNDSHAGSQFSQRRDDHVANLDTHKHTGAGVWSECFQAQGPLERWVGRMDRGPSRFGGVLRVPFTEWMDGNDKEPVDTNADSLWISASGEIWL